MILAVMGHRAQPEMPSLRCASQWRAVLRMVWATARPRRSRRRRYGVADAITAGGFEPGAARLVRRREHAVAADACPGANGANPVPIQLADGVGQVGDGIDGDGVSVESAGVMDVDADKIAEHIILSQCSFGGNATSTYVAAIRPDDTGTVVTVGDLLTVEDSISYRWGWTPSTSALTRSRPTRCFVSTASRSASATR